MISSREFTENFKSGKADLDEPIVLDEPCCNFTAKDYLDILWGLYRAKSFNISNHKHEMTQKERMVCNWVVHFLYFHPKY